MTRNELTGLRMTAASMVKAGMMSEGRYELVGVRGECIMFGLTKERAARYAATMPGCSIRRMA